MRSCLSCWRYFSRFIEGGETFPPDSSWVCRSPFAYIRRCWFCTSCGGGSSERRVWALGPLLGGPFSPAPTFGLAQTGFIFCRGGRKLRGGLFPLRNNSPPGFFPPSGLGFGVIPPI